MEDKELYQHILGLETPWSVAEVKLDLDQQQIDIHVSHPRGTKFCCPECNQSLSCYDYVIARPADRQWIRETPVELRPNRPMHFWGNSRRRTLR